MGIMREYKKPVMKVERFTLSDAVAAQCTYTPGTTAGQVTVYCAIGKQSESVYSSACSTTSATITSYSGQYYLVWYTYSGDMGSGGIPDSSLTDFLSILVNQIKGTTGVDYGSGWHYAAIDYDADTQTIITNLSY